jgi:hypothetical protein
MRILVLLALAVGLGLLAIQNGSLATLMVFGYQTLALPVAAWMVGAIAAGILTSAILQLLNYRPAPALPPPRNPEPKNPERFPRDRTRAFETEPVADRPRAPQTVSDWETPKTQDDDWNVATPPPRPNFSKAPRAEASEKPKSQTPSDSGFRPRDRDEAKTKDERDRVYDANYRVIDPPVAEEPAKPQTVNEEDWGFDDEEFESEYRRQYHDR